MQLRTEPLSGVRISGRREGLRVIPGPPYPGELPPDKEAGDLRRPAYLEQPENRPRGVLEQQDPAR